MTPEEFNQNLKRLAREYKDFFDIYAPVIVSKEAVSFFKQSFQNEEWGGTGWQRVKRLDNPKNFKTLKSGKRKGETVAVNARGRRKILTGDTGDLGRSIEVKGIAPGTVIIWTNPSVFTSKVPYGRVHNEGLKAGRGSGFIMPKRQFMGDDPELNKIIIEKLESKLKEIFI